jgi:hypothetical protein
MQCTVYALAALCLAGGCAAEPFRPLPKKRAGDGLEFCAAPDLPLAVAANGQLQLGNRSAKLPLGRHETLDALWAHPQGDAVLIAYESTDAGEDGVTSHGGLCKYASADARELWCTAIDTFNIVAAAADSGALYIAGVGLAARIDTNTGRYLWKIDDLYVKDRAFNRFKIPTEQDGRVVFTASAGTPHAPLKSLTVQRDTGVVVPDDSNPSAADFVRLGPDCK